MEQELNLEGQKVPFDREQVRLAGSPQQPSAARASSGKRGHVHRDPGREALPGSGVAERLADLLQDDHENRRPDRYALHLACGPPVVTDHQQEQRCEADEVGLPDIFVLGPTSAIYAYR